MTEPASVPHLQSTRQNNRTIPSVSITTARTGVSSKADELGMRPMQQLAYGRRGEQFLPIKSPPASGKSRALMFIALDKLHNQGLQQAILLVRSATTFSDKARSGSARRPCGPRAPIPKSGVSHSRKRLTHLAPSSRSR